MSQIQKIIYWDIFSCPHKQLPIDEPNANQKIKYKIKPFMQGQFPYQILTDRCKHNSSISSVYECYSKLKRFYWSLKVKICHPQEDNISIRRKQYFFLLKNYFNQLSNIKPQQGFQLMYFTLLSSKDKKKQDNNIRQLHYDINIDRQQLQYLNKFYQKQNKSKIDSYKQSLFVFSPYIRGKQLFYCIMSNKYFLQNLKYVQKLILDLFWLFVRGGGPPLFTATLKNVIIDYDEHAQDKKLSPKSFSNKKQKQPRINFNLVSTPGIDFIYNRNQVSIEAFQQIYPFLFYEQETQSLNKFRNFVSLILIIICRRPIVLQKQGKQQISFQDGLQKSKSLAEKYKVLIDESSDRILQFESSCNMKQNALRRLFLSELTGQAKQPNKSQLNPNNEQTQQTKQQQKDNEQDTPIKISQWNFVHKYLFVRSNKKMYQTKIKQSHLLKCMTQFFGINQQYCQDKNLQVQSDLYFAIVLDVNFPVLIRKSKCGFWLDCLNDDQNFCNETMQFVFRTLDQVLRKMGQIQKAYHCSSDENHVQKMRKLAFNIIQILEQYLIKFRKTNNSILSVRDQQFMDSLTNKYYSQTESS